MDEKIYIKEITDEQFKIGDDEYIESIFQDGERNIVIILNDGFEFFFKFVKNIEQKGYDVVNCYGFDDMTCEFQNGNFKMNLNYFIEEEGMVVLSAFCKNQNELYEFRMLAH